VKARLLVYYCHVFNTQVLSIQVYCTFNVVVVLVVVVVVVVGVVVVGSLLLECDSLHCTYTYLLYEALCNSISAGCISVVSDLNRCKLNQFLSDSLNLRI